MKEVGIRFICFVLGIVSMGLFMGLIASFNSTVEDIGEEIMRIGETPYDPNDLIYKYIPPAHESWIKEFGDSERTRLFHSVSELRAIQAALNKRLMYLESLHTDPNDPNGVKE